MLASDERRITYQDLQKAVDTLEKARGHQGPLQFNFSEVWEKDMLEMLRGAGYELQQIAPHEYMIGGNHYVFWPQMEGAQTAGGYKRELIVSHGRDENAPFYRTVKRGRK